jgi:hypothetical protein
MAVGHEAPRLQRRAFRFGAREVGEAHDAAVARGAGPGLVHDDAGDPGAERRFAGVAVEAGDHHDPGVLHRLLRPRAGAGEDAGEPDEASVVPPHQLPEGRFFARPEARQERGVLVQGHEPSSLRAARPT